MCEMALSKAYLLHTRKVERFDAGSQKVERSICRKVVIEPVLASRNFANRQLVKLYFQRGDESINRRSVVRIQRRRGIRCN